MVSIKQAIFEADVQGMWEYHLPKVAATGEQVAATEAHLGLHLDQEYREFLGFANGWPSFFQTVDLFGTDDLVGGPRLEIAQAMVGAIDPIVFEQAGLEPSAVLPIAASTVDLDLFLMPVSNGHLVPPIVWLAAVEVDRFTSFRDYVLAMIEYNGRELARLNR